MKIADLAMIQWDWRLRKPNDSMSGLTITSRRFSVANKPVLSSEQEQGRAKNAVADLLSRQLIVPKVFFDAHWPSRKSRVDVLAVDRSGSGEVHVVEVKRWRDLKVDL